MKTGFVTLRRWAWTLLGVCLLASAAAAQSLEVIDLEYRTAAEVIPVLQPMLEPGGALSGQDYKLFVRASKSNLAQLRSVLTQIDRQARQLLVSVRQGSQQDLERQGVSASGTIRSGNASAAVNERPRARSGVTVRATDTTTSTQDGSMATVAVIEGNSAFISTGTSVPIVTAVAAGGGREPFVASSTSYRDLNSGFMVTPRVNGDQVVLDIEQQDERVNRGNIETQRLTTQAAGRLGEWIELGGVNESATSTRSGILDRQYSTRTDARSIWIKVDAQ